MSIPYIDTAAIWDWSMYQGDTRVFSFSVEDNDDDPIDLTGVVITMTIKKQRGASVPSIYTATTTSGAIVVSGAGVNTVTITIPATNTAMFPSGALVYDIEFVLGSQVVTYITGTITVQTEVSL